MGNGDSKQAEEPVAPPLDNWNSAYNFIDPMSFRMLESCACAGTMNEAEDDMDEKPEHDMDDRHVARGGDLSFPSRSMRSAPGGPSELTNPANPASETPMTFEQATGQQSINQERRARAYEVAESEHNFMREFSAMMKSGLTVVRRQRLDDGGAAAVEFDGGVQVHLVLDIAKGGLVSWTLFAEEGQQGEAGRMPLANINRVKDKPYPAHLPEDLNLRSFIIEARGGESLLFHAESCDICSLIVDGLKMVIRDQHRATKRALTLKAQQLNTAAAARPGHARVVLGYAKNLVPVCV